MGAPEAAVPGHIRSRVLSHRDDGHRRPAPRPRPPDARDQHEAMTDLAGLELPVTESRGQTVLHVPRERLAEIVLELRDEHAFNMCIDVTAVDYLAYHAPRALPEGVDAGRFEIV